MTTTDERPAPKRRRVAPVVADPMVPVSAPAPAVPAAAPLATAAAEPPATNAEPTAPTMAQAFARNYEPAPPAEVTSVYDDEPEAEDFPRLPEASDGTPAGEAAAASSNLMAAFAAPKSGNEATVATYLRTSQGAREQFLELVAISGRSQRDVFELIVADFYHRLKAGRA